MHIKQTLLLFFALAYAGISHAAMYKWVDDSGRTIYGDSVPEKYRAGAEIVEIKENVVPASKTQTLPKAEDETGAILENTKEKKEPKVLEMTPPKDLPTSQLKAEDECELKMQEFREAQECFVPYRNVRGGIDEEGVKRCPNVQQPDCAKSKR